MNGFLSVLILLVILLTPVAGCSDFLLKTDNPEVVISGRTIDWFEKEGVIGSFMVEVRDQQWESLSSINPLTPGFSWKNQYGFVGIESNFPQVSGFPESRKPQYIETLNEEGLSAGFLTLVEAEYPARTNRSEKALFYMDLVSYLAGTFRTVYEVKQGLQEVEIWCPPELSGKDPLHLIVHDADGKTLIAEWVRNETGEIVMNIYDGPDVDNRGGVLTNDPSYPKQLKNLANYENATPQNLFYGLPGGPSPADRFVRLTKLNQFNIPLESGPDKIYNYVIQAFHLLNAVDVVFGEEPTVLLDNGEENSDTLENGADTKVIFSHKVQIFTLFTLVRDHTNRVYYVKTYTNQNIGKIDLKKFDFISGSYQKTSDKSPYPEEPYDFTRSFTR